MAYEMYRHHYNAPLPPSPPEAPPAPPTTDASDFAQLGVVFNDATRALVGGLWQTAVEESGQGNGSVYRYVNDLQSVHDGIQAQIKAGTFTGDALANAQSMLNDITTAISAAQASTNGGGAYGNVAAAEQALHDSHINVLKTVAGDATLSQMAAKDGATGFTAVPPTLDGANPHNAPHATLAEIGSIFDDAANRIMGGVNADNKHAISSDIHAVLTDMKQFVGDQPDAFSGLTGIHADAVMRQLQLELDFIKQADGNPVAGRASNDNMLDIIDIVQGDENLARMASQNGVSGFTPLPDALNETPQYQDNEAQTNFWANFIANSNSFSDQAAQLVGSGDKAATHALITQLKGFQQDVTQFDAAQGGIFEARFDNELLGKNSTLGAEVQAMIKGLKSGDAGLVAAAGEEMHANAADVGGNNVGFDGTMYNTDGRSTAEVLSQPPEGPIPAIATSGGSTPGTTANTQMPMNIAEASGPNVAVTNGPQNTDGPMLQEAHSAAAQAVTAFPAATGAPSASGATSTPVPSTGAAAAAAAPAAAGVTAESAHTTPLVDVAVQHHFEHMWG